MEGIVQRSFAGGEIAPSLIKRPDVAKVQSAVKTMRNFTVDRTGAAINRTGFKYLGVTKGSTGNERLIKFVVNDTQTYVLEFGATYMRVWAGDETITHTGSRSDWASATAYVVGDLVVDGSASGSTGDYFYCVAGHTSTANDSPDLAAGTDYFWYPLVTSTHPVTEVASAILEVPTVYAAADLVDIQYVQSGDILTLTHADYPPHEVRRTSDTAWTCLPFDLRRPVAQPVHASSGGGGAGANDIRYKVTARLPDTFEESATWGTAGGVTVAGTITSAAMSSTSDDIVVDDVAHGMATADEIALRTIATTTATQKHENAIRALTETVWRITKINNDSFSLDRSAGLVSAGPLTGYSSGGYTIAYLPANLEFLSKISPATTSINFAWVAIPEAEDYVVYRSINDGEYGFLGIAPTSAFTDDQPLLAEDLTDTAPEFRSPFVYGDWPRSTTYYQQRQFFGGTNDSPSKIWASKLGDFHNFSTRTPLTDSDATSFTISEARANELATMSSLGQLLFFANGAVHTARGDESGAFTASTINLRTLDSHGSKALQPLMVGDTVLYLQSRGRQPREIRYDLIEGGNVGGYAGRDTTIYSAGLFDGYDITEWAYAEAPNSVVWALRSDGRLLAMTHLNEQEILAWSQHDTRPATDVIQSIAVVPNGGVDTPYVIVQRSVNGSTAYHVELMSPRITGEYQQDYRVASYYVDSYLSYDGTNATATTLTLTGGSTWAVGETGLTLTASTGTFPGDTTNVGNGYRLVGSDGAEVDVEVTTDGSTTVQTVTILGIPTGESAAAASVQSTALTTWVAMVDDLAGLDHLEAETVQIIADGLNLGTDTVSSGAITTLSRPYGVIHVGLAITAEIEALDLDVAGGGDTISDRRQTVPTASLFVENTVGVTVGTDTDNLAGYGNKHGYVDPQLITGTLGYRLATGPTDHGRITIRQESGRAAKILGFVRHTGIGGRVD